MKKVLFVFSAAVLAAMTACGPSAEELAAKEKARQDSIAAVEAMEQARLDSIAAAEAMEQARLDSIAAADAMAAEAASSKGGSKPKGNTSTPKDEPKKEETPVKQGGMKGNMGGGQETPKSGETPVKKGGMKGNMK